MLKSLFLELKPKRNRRLVFSSVQIEINKRICRGVRSGKKNDRIETKFGETNVYSSELFGLEV